jgi:outer membrane protein OmpA-like peptidoglycan-associated protein
MRFKAVLASCVLALLPLQASAQQTSGSSTSLIDIHVSQNLPTVNYWANGSTKVDFVGTALVPRADGEAKVGAQHGVLRIQADFKGLVPPTTLGNVYLVYVLWAITPDGRATNLGQLFVKDGKATMDVTTKLQTFGMMVTAEPYFAVSFPSEKVALSNVVRRNTKGAVSEVDARMALLQRGKYPNADFSSYAPLDKKVPLALYQARNAVRIAKWQQAQKYAPEALANSEQSLNQAEGYQQRKEKHPLETVARQAVQSAEDAREIAVKRMHQAEIAQAQAASQAQAQQAQTQAQLARAQAQQAQEQAKLQEEKRAVAQQQQLLAEQQAAAAQAAQETAERQAQSARDAAARADQEKQQLRAQLLAQFNRVLPTTDTPRGLQVNLGDVLFATAKAILQPAAKEALARFSGIVMNYPTLQFSVEGYTDSTGTQAFNQALSEKRAESVKDYLALQGVSANAISATGLGESNPVASNSTAAGRQKNRRVEIIVSGNVIGTKIGGAR